MANSVPFEQLTGTLSVYIAPAIEAPPAVNATPAGNWVNFGHTDGDQIVRHAGDLTYLRDNDWSGPVKAVRPEEGLEYEFTLVSLTLENWARVLHAVSKVTADAGPPAIKTLPFSRGFVPTEYSILLKGLAQSPYGAYPAFWYISRCVLGGEPEPTFTKEGRPGLLVKAVALWDSTQAAGKELGWAVAQTS